MGCIFFSLPLLIRRRRNILHQTKHLCMDLAIPCSKVYCKIRPRPLLRHYHHLIRRPNHKMYSSRNKCPRVRTTRDFKCLRVHYYRFYWETSLCLSLSACLGYLLKNATMFRHVYNKIFLIFSSAISHTIAEANSL